MYYVRFIYKFDLRECSLLNNSNTVVYPISLSLLSLILFNPHMVIITTQPVFVSLVYRNKNIYLCIY